MEKPTNNKSPNNRPVPPAPQLGGNFFWGVMIMAALWMFMQGSKNKDLTPITFTQFIEEVKKDQIETVVFEGTSIYGKFKDTMIDGKSVVGKGFQSYGDTSSDVYLKILQDKNITPVYRAPSDYGLLWSIVISFGSIFLLFWLLNKRSGGSGAGSPFSFGKMSNLLKTNSSKVTFADVAGIDEVKQEIMEIVDCLKNPQRYREMGATIPKGVLLFGGPGTGKTLLAKAIANEAGVPFFSAGGSEFVEMFVGVGASRVRSLFEQAKKNAPCLVFIDEIDAIAKHRGGVGSMSGGHDEQNQTLNQILTEMQGFEENSGIIIIAATNRPEVLDPAILRPGRFDRKIYVSPPDMKGREAILKIHAKGRKMSPDINFEQLSKATAGMSGADLENLLNEAALLAVRKKEDVITMKVIEEARDKILMGVERKNLVTKDEEKRKTAYHEAGHAIMPLVFTNLNRLHKVSIIPRNMSLGVTQTTSEENQVSFDHKQAEAFLCFCFGGRAAEEVIFNHFSSGASDDLKKATSIARRMICEWGMSKKFGPISFSQSQNGLENNLISPETMKQIDEEIQNILTKAYKKTVSILTDNKKALDKITEMLMANETCTGEEITEAVKDMLVKDSVNQELA